MCTVVVETPICNPVTNIKFSPLGWQGIAFLDSDDSDHVTCLLWDSICIIPHLRYGQNHFPKLRVYCVIKLYI